MKNNLSDIERLRKCWALRINAELIDEELRELETWKLLRDEQMERLQSKLRQERNGYAAEWNRIIAYISSIDSEELRKMFLYRFIKRLDYPEIHKKIYGFPNPNAGSMIRKRISRYVERHPIGEPEQIQEQPQRKE